MLFIYKRLYVLLETYQFCVLLKIKQLYVQHEIQPNHLREAHDFFFYSGAVVGGQGRLAEARAG